MYDFMLKEEWDDVMLIVLVYSFFEKIKEYGDLYFDQLEEFVKLIVEGVGIIDYVVGWQSEGNIFDLWFGLDVQDFMCELY